MITIPFIVSLVVSAASTVVVLAMILVLGFGNRSRGQNQAIPDREEMRKHALWHMLYVNDADPRGWVPKLYGYGLTVNFRRKSLAVVFATSLALVLASTACLVVFRPH